MQINIDGQPVEVSGAPDVDLDSEEVIFEGERLTSARAEAIAREVSRAHGRKGGRPSLDEGQSPRISLRVPRPLKRRLEAAAQREGRAEAELVREALARYLAG